MLCCSVKEEFFYLGQPIVSLSYRIDTNLPTTEVILPLLYANIKFPEKTSAAKFSQKETPAAKDQRCDQIPVFANKNIFNKRLYELYLTFVISGLRREIGKNCIFLDYYAASSGNFLPKFRNKLSVPFSGFKGSDDRIEGGLHHHSICLLAELATKGKIYRSEDMPKYGQSVFTKVLAEEVKGLQHRHAGEPGNYVKTNHHILRSDS